MANPFTDRLIAGTAELTEPIATGDADPAGGALAGLVTALAASLTAAAAGRSRSVWEEAPAVRAQAQALRRRALEVSRRTVEAHAGAVSRLAERGDGGSDARDWEVGRSVSAAAAPPLELTACARDLAELASLVADHADPDVRADAVVAAMLAAAAARSAAHLVEINLVTGADETIVGQARARALEAEAAVAKTAGAPL
jgi:formiminotetrahydrofolate cyclodeaminase